MQKKYREEYYISIATILSWECDQFGVKNVKNVANWKNSKFCTKFQMRGVVDSPKKNLTQDYPTKLPIVMPILCLYPSNSPHPAITPIINTLLRRFCQNSFSIFQSFSPPQLHQIDQHPMSYMITSQFLPLDLTPIHSISSIIPYICNLR